MAKKAQPKKSLGGDLVRRTFTPPTKAPYNQSMDFEMEGHHSKPTGGASNTKYGAKRGDAKFFKHTTKGK